jgi:large subunit ribosomal protein L25
MSEIEVEALPQNLPHSIIVDLSVLAELNQTIYVRDIKAPKGVKIVVDPETAVASALPQAAEEVVETPIDVADVKVESEEKKAERAAGKEEKAGE